MADGWRWVAMGVLAGSSTPRSLPFPSANLSETIPPRSFQNRSAAIASSSSQSIFTFVTSVNYVNSFATVDKPRDSLATSCRGRSAIAIFAISSEQKQRFRYVWSFYRQVEAHPLSITPINRLIYAHRGAIKYRDLEPWRESMPELIE